MFTSILLSCENNSNSTKPKPLENDGAGPDTALTTSHDSLDIDTSSFIITALPDTVRQILYVTNQRLNSYIARSYTEIIKEDTFFSLPALKQITLTDGFTTDSMEDATLFSRRSFNKRELIQYTASKKNFKIAMQSQLWFLGKKYQSLWLRIFPKKKDETVTNDF